MIIVGLAVAWFFPLLEGSSFSAVPGYRNAVYPWAATSNGQAFYPQSDQAALSLPWQTELTDALGHGSIPWWNDESFGGQPLFANGSSALLYPPRLLLAATVRPTTAYNLLSFMHVALAGVFCYWLLADLELSPLAALFGSVAWMFGAFTLGWLELEVVAPLFAWFPAGLVTMRRSVLRSSRWVVAAAGAIAMLFVSTHLLFADICVVVIGLYGGCLALRQSIPRWRRTRGWTSLVPLAKAGAGLGLGVGLAAFVLLPTALVLSDISRQTLSFSGVTQGFGLTPADLRFALWPASRPITIGEMQWGLGFVGTLSALFALVGLFMRRKGAGLGRGLAIGAVLVGIGGPVGFVAFEVIPGLNVFHPYSRLLFVFDLGLAMLAAVGLDAVMGWISEPPRAVDGNTGQPTRTGGRSNRWWLSRSMAVVVIVVTALQLGWYGRSITPPFLPSTSRFEFRTTPLIRALQTKSDGVAGWPNRVLPANDTTSGWSPPMLDGDDPLIFGIKSANGYDSSVPTRTVDIWQVVNGEVPSAVIETKLDGAFNPTYDAASVRFDLLPRLGVNRIALTPPAAAVPTVARTLQALGWRPTYVGADGTVYAWAGTPTGPTVVFDVRRSSSDAEALDLFTDPAFDYRSEVILDASATNPFGASGGATGAPARATVNAASEGINSASITVHSSRPGWLVIPEMWDAGWSATVNGGSETVERANFNEQAVAVPSGVSVVRLRYLPTGLVTGTIVTVVAAIVCVVILVVPRRRRRGSRDRVQRLRTER